MATLSVTADSADLKVILVGSSGTGKTCLFERYLNNHYANDPHRVDTAGSERYESITRNFFRNAGAAIICYEISSEPTFERALRYCRELQQSEPECKIYFCGTKLDLVVTNASLRSVDLNDVCKYAAEIKAEAIETSSKSGENITELFDLIAEDFAKDPQSAANSDSYCDYYSMIRREIAVHSSPLRERIRYA